MCPTRPKKLWGSFWQEGGWRLKKRRSRRIEIPPPPAFLGFHTRGRGVPKVKTIRLRSRLVTAAVVHLSPKSQRFSPAPPSHLASLHRGTPPPRNPPPSSPLLGWRGVGIRGPAGLISSIGKPSLSSSDLIWSLLVFAATNPTQFSLHPPRRILLPLHRHLPP
jgi:hypothetical protein